MVLLFLIVTLFAYGLLHHAGWPWLALLGGMIGLQLSRLWREYFD